MLGDEPAEKTATNTAITHGEYLMPNAKVERPRTARELGARR